MEFKVGDRVIYCNCVIGTIIKDDKTLVPYRIELDNGVIT